MKPLLLISLLLILMMGCRKEDSCMDSGTITGLDTHDWGIRYV